MLESAKVTVFASTMDLNKSRKFYQEGLRLNFVSECPLVLVFSCGNTLLRFSKVKDFEPGPATMGWEVSDIRKAVLELSERGIKTEKMEKFEQDELGIWTSPMGTKVAWLKDPDGNTLTLSQPVNNN
jgi:catechol 2,3-dioxygenase-like lactoylglutathione lyase family enzyme